jgi:hypothetical protein
MPDIQSVIQDPKFQALGPHDQLQVLSHVDPNFARLSPSDQQQVIGKISNTVMIGGQAVNLKTGQGASSAATAQAQQTGAAVQPINKTAGILASGPQTLPADIDPRGTIAPSAGAQTGLGIMGNLIGHEHYQSTAQAQQNAKNAIVAAGMSLAPELIPEVAGSGALPALANVGIRAVNSGISGGAATALGQGLVAENPLDTASLKETGTNALISAFLGAGSKAIEQVPAVAKAAKSGLKNTFGEPEALPLQGEVPKPVSQPLPVDSPFDNATIRKSAGGKDLNPDAREFLRNAAGPVIPAGSSPELHLLRAVPEVNSTLATQSAALDTILQNAKPLAESPKSAVTDALNTLKSDLPGGSEETLSRAILKEETRYAQALESTSPVEINQTIRDLDKRINSYSADSEPLEGPASAQDAALVVMRRTLRDALNKAIPESAPINKELSSAIEVKSVLRKKLGSVANDSGEAASQYNSELAKGQAQLQRETANQAIADELAARKAKVSRNKSIAKTVGAVALGGGLLEAGKSAASHFVK